MGGMPYAGQAWPFLRDWAFAGPSMPETANAPVRPVMADLNIAALNSEQRKRRTRARLNPD